MPARIRTAAVASDLATSRVVMCQKAAVDAPAVAVVDAAVVAVPDVETVTAGLVLRMSDLAHFVTQD